MENFITENPALLIVVFAAVCVIIVTLLIVGKVKSNAKKKNLLADNPNFVEILFDENVYFPIPHAPFDYAGYKLYSVNGQPAKPIGRSLVIPAGETTLDVEYFFQQKGKNFVTSMGRSSYTLTTAPGSRYVITFNYMDKCLEHRVK